MVLTFRMNFVPSSTGWLFVKLKTAICLIPNSHLTMSGDKNCPLLHFRSSDWLHSFQPSPTINAVSPLSHFSIPLKQIRSPWRCSQEFQPNVLLLYNAATQNTIALKYRSLFTLASVKIHRRNRRSTEQG